MEIIIRGIKMSLIKVNKNENPYHIIGEYIEKHITYVDDIIAVISLDGNIINELFLVEITTESNFIWQNDWWEGEENVELIDFFFVSDACKRCDDNDLISKQAAIDTFYDLWGTSLTRTVDAIKRLPSIQPKRGKWLYQIGMIKCDQCLRAIRRIDHDGLLNFCPNCGADMREVTE